MGLLEHRQDVGHMVAAEVHARAAAQRARGRPATLMARSRL
jgi:hypothetical protein